MDTPQKTNNITTDPADPNAPLVVAFRPADAINAEIVRSALEAEGIFAVIGEQVTSAYEGPFSVGEGAWGDILVRETDAARAQQILAGYEAQNQSATGVDLAELTAQAEAASDPQV